MESMLSNIQKRLFGLESIEEAITSRLKRLHKNNRGSSLIILGPPSCGKRSIVEKAIAKESGLVIVRSRGAFEDVSAVKEKIQKVEENLIKKKKVIYIVYNFSEIPTSFGSKLLYSLTQSIHSGPLMLIVTGEVESGVSFFEKRVASRLAEDIIKVDALNISDETLWKNFRQMMHSSAPLNASILALFRIPEEMPNKFAEYSRKLPVYGNLKLFAKRIVDEVFDSGLKKSAAEVIDEILNERRDIYAEMLEEVPVRWFCLLVAAAIAAPNLYTYIPVTEVEIAYKFFCNKYNAPPKLRIDDLEIPSIMKELVALNFWEARTQGDRITLICWKIDPAVLLNCERDTLITEWMKENETSIQNPI